MSGMKMRLSESMWPVNKEFNYNNGSLWICALQ